MGLLSTLIKIAATTAISSVGSNVGKQIGNKINGTIKEKTGGTGNQKTGESKQTINKNEYAVYIYNNLTHVVKVLDSLQNETSAIISKINIMKISKLSLKEKMELKKLIKTARENLKYLYLSKDLFTLLTKAESGISLQKKEIKFISKFIIYFDGVLVLDPTRDYGFDFQEYIYTHHERKIHDIILPNLEDSITAFINLMKPTETIIEEKTLEEAVTDTKIDIQEIECPNCHATISTSSKFCPECGTKIEVKTNKHLYCSNCGQPLNEGAKFCGNCGEKV